MDPVQPDCIVPRWGAPLEPVLCYERSWKLWAVIWQDWKGNQVGGAEYFPTKKMAKEEMRIPRTYGDRPDTMLFGRRNNFGDIGQ